MGKVDVGGGKPLAPSPKTPVAAPTPKHVAPTPSFPKPSRASVYRGSAAHQASHSRAYGPRGSGVHAAVQAQPVRSSGHSAAVARLAAKLAQQSSAQASRRATLTQQFLRSANNVWGAVNPNGDPTTGAGLPSLSFNPFSAPFGPLVEPAVLEGLRRQGLLPTGPRPTAPYNVGPQGGLYDKGFPGYDRLPGQPPMGEPGHFTQRIPIPKFNTSPRYRTGPLAGQPKPRGEQQRSLGIQREPAAVRTNRI